MHTMHYTLTACTLRNMAPLVRLAPRKRSNCYVLVATGIARIVHKASRSRFVLRNMHASKGA